MKQILIIAIATLIVSCKLSNTNPHREANKELAVLFENYYDERLHLYPLEATAFGDNRFNDQLPVDFSDSYREQLKDFYNRYKIYLGKFDREYLNEQDRLSYDVFNREMNINLESFNFKENYIPFHPTLNCRAMYYKIRPEGMGRDCFEALCKAYGFSVERKGNLFRTTDSSGVVRFDDLLKTADLSNINEAWSSDITYFEVKERFYYITFILDCFSRRILGYNVSDRLTTEQTTLPALKAAIKTRAEKVPAQMIFHSDGGGQYYDKEFLKYTAAYQMRNSMCEFAYENGKAERLNGIIKNNYLAHYRIKTYQELRSGVDRAVTLYNHQRPHKALKYQTPVGYEKTCVSLHQQTKPVMTGSLDAKHNLKGASGPIQIEQTKPPIPGVYPQII